MGVLNWLFGPKSEEWYQKQLEGVLAEHKERKEEFDEIEALLSKEENVSLRIKMEGKAGGLNTKIRTLEFQIVTIISRMKRYGYRIPSEYFDRYPRLRDFQSV